MQSRNTIASTVLASHFTPGYAVISNMALDSSLPRQEVPSLKTTPISGASHHMRGCLKSHMIKIMLISEHNYGSEPSK